MSNMCMCLHVCPSCLDDAVVLINAYSMRLHKVATLPLFASMSVYRLHHFYSSCSDGLCGRTESLLRFEGYSFAQT